MGCQEDITTSVAGDLVPVNAVTVELTLEFHEFAENLEAWGGYGQPYELARDLVATAFEGSLDARVLNSWNSYPVAATVRDSTGVFNPDSTLTFVGGKVVARFDTLTSLFAGPVTLAVSALPEEWDVRTVRWDAAVDSLGDLRPWEEPGAGPATLLSTATWDPEAGDSVTLELDSAGVAVWADTAGALKGARLDAVTEGTRLDLTGLSLTLATRPSSNPDTLVDLQVATRSRTFIFQPEPEPPQGEIRVGGVPAWRSVFEMDMPFTLDGPPELCQKVQCPFTLKPEGVISASLVLTTKAPPPAFQPRDTLRLDVRPVLEPSRLPKSPLGNSLVGIAGVTVAPEGFGEDAGLEVEVPVGPYIQVLLSESTKPELDVPKTLALLSSFEPLSLYFASFEGPDSPDGPKLRLILTLAEDVLIR
jgi:hypothetical protein